MTAQRPAGSPVEYGAVLRQIGMTEAGGPIYAYRDGSPVVQAAPVVPARPWGAYVALGIAGTVGIGFLAMAAAILAIAVAVGGVCLTVCLLVLRQMWGEIKADRKAARDR